MADSSTPPPRYRLHHSAAILAQLRALARRAEAAGAGALMAEALRNLQTRPTTEADEFGEPLYRLPAIPCQVRVGFAPPLAATIALDWTRNDVYLIRVALLSRYHF